MPNWSSSREVAIIPKIVSAAHAKAQLSALMAKVAYGGHHVIIERRGKPLVALVTVDELHWLEQREAAAPRPSGALALTGAWTGLLEDTEIDSLVDHIYEEREKDTGRRVELGE